MTAPKASDTFGDGAVDRLISELISTVGQDRNDDLVRQMIVTALQMDDVDVDRLELKIASQTLVEMLNGYQVFRQNQDRPKVTVFGSARTSPDHPDYAITQQFASAMAEDDWMVISGAGPGIMTAAIEGAGVENSFGVSIVLPFEARAADIIDGDSKLAVFRYFFTRKLFFMKESDGFACLPGGFGTLDETFELFTLIQTGKSFPAPIVLLDHPGSTYWSSALRFIEDGLAANGMIGGHDTEMFLHTHDPVEAANYIAHFYSTYHSIRYVGSRLIVRLRVPLSDTALDALNAEFADIVTEGVIEVSQATPSEVNDDDHVAMPRLALRFNNRSFARLVAMIHRINELGAGSDRVDDAGFIHDLPIEDGE